MQPRAATLAPPAAGADGAHRPGARIGPNAVTQLAAAIRHAHGEEKCREVFARAFLLHHLARPPADMVDELDAARLNLALRQCLTPAEADAAARDAGRRTALYLLENRIPRLAQAVLRRLPLRLGVLILTRAIARHAWTFAGSGAFSASGGLPMRLEVRGGPVARLVYADAPVCAYYAATFEGVFSGALGRPFIVEETNCEATGAEACRFVLTPRPRP